MPLLAEYAITPDVFETTSYSSEDVCGLHLSTIREVMTDEGLVRDLREGEWRALFANHGRSWHRRGKKIVQKLATQGRLIKFPAELPDAPTNNQGWCDEALAGHQRKPLTGGVIVTQPIKGAYRNEPLVARVDRLAMTPWWTKRSPSLRLDRNLAAYQRHLDPILRCANSLQFIDPHLDPGQRRYRDFANLLAAAGRRSPAPLIEIHRVCYRGSGPGRRLLDYREIERVFRSELAATLGAAGLSAEVFIWDDFHDRYLLSNLIGISLPNGFDTTGSPDDRTTWTRLGHPDRDNIQREFDRASGHHTLHANFTLG